MTFAESLGHAVIIRRAVDALDAQREPLPPDGDPADQRAFIVGRADTPLDRPRDAAVGDRRRHLLIKQVDRTADRAAAIEQRRGPAQHLDPAQQ